MKRLTRHLLQNEERKLTPEQRKEKKLKKLRDSLGEVGHLTLLFINSVLTQLFNQTTIGVALYKIDDVSSPLCRRKMDYTAKEGGLTGVLIIDHNTANPTERVIHCGKLAGRDSLFYQCNMVVVEGAPRALKKFKKLMLRRMDWNVSINPRLQIRSFFSPNLTMYHYATVRNLVLTWTFQTKLER